MVDVNTVLWIVIPGGMVGVLLWFLLRNKGGSGVQIADRAGYEKAKRITELSQNANNIGGLYYKKLYHGRRYLGDVQFILPSYWNPDRKEKVNEDAKTESDVAIIEIVYKRSGFFSGKTDMVLLRSDNQHLIRDEVNHNLIISEHVAIDSYNGWNWDITDTPVLKGYVDAHKYKTDLEGTNTIYFAESQKRSAIDFTNAAEVVRLNAEIQKVREEVQRTRG